MGTGAGGGSEADVLARTAEIEPGTRLHSEVAIIGAGAAGITLAGALEGLGHHVIVLESGFEAIEPDVQSIYEGQIVGFDTEPLDTSRLRMFGGSTNHWAGWCRPLEAVDFEAHDGWPTSGWPFEGEALKPYYRHAAALCELGPDHFDDLEAWRALHGGEVVNPLALDPGRATTAIFQVSPPTNFAEVHGPGLLASANVTVLLGATALGLIAGENTTPDRVRKHVAGVYVGDLAGRRFEVRSRFVVCATGGIEIARFLLLSREVHPAGAGNEHDLVGRYFMDHPWVGRAAYLQFSEPDPPLATYFTAQDLGGAEMFASIASSEAWRRREGLGGYRLVLHPTTVSTAGMDSARAITKGLSDGRVVDDLWQHLAAVLRDVDVIADAALKTLFDVKSTPLSREMGDDAPVVGAYVDLNIEQIPNRDSRVKLGSELDGLGQPQTVLDWRLSDIDGRTAEAALHLLGLEVGRLGLGRVRLIEGADQLPNVWPSRTIGSRHHMGTARMNTNPRLGVTDSWGRVHSTENLFVAGSALFPTGGYANPTLTIVALALRQAEHLKHLLDNG